MKTDFNQKDLQIRGYQNSSPLRTLSITHLPTGITVHGETTWSLHKLKEELLQQLAEKISLQSLPD